MVPANMEHILTMDITPTWLGNEKRDSLHILEHHLGLYYSCAGDDHFLLVH